MSRSFPLYQVNAFTPEPFRGNPAAVCVLPDYPDPAWLQSVAAEMNLSETAFLVATADPLRWQLRWFTPQVEVNLCGHATLASAHALFSQNHVAPGLVMTFTTRSGDLSARQQQDWIELDFPAQPVTPQPANFALLTALDIPPEAVKFSGSTQENLFIEVKDPSIVRQCHPNFRELAQIPGLGVIVTAKSDLPNADFISRFFAPRAGINEDPVTGSTHCSLYPYWQAQLNKANLTGYQASQRGGWVKLRGEGDRVYLSGQAVTVWQGNLLVDF